MPTEVKVGQVWSSISANSLIQVVETTPTIIKIVYLNGFGSEYDLSAETLLTVFQHETCFDSVSAETQSSDTASTETKTCDYWDCYAPAEKDSKFCSICFKAVHGAAYEQAEREAIASSDEPSSQHDAIQWMQDVYYERETKCTCDFVTQLLPYGCKCGGR